MIELSNVTPKLFLHEDLVIVGSAATLKEKECGRYIDTFMEVVRFNRAPTNGWEKHVGYKTTLRVTNNHVFANVRHNVGGDEDCEDWKSVGQPQNFIKELKNQRILLLNKDSSAWEEKIEHVDNSSTAYIGDYDKASHFGKTNSPSVGYAFISLCIMNGIRPVLFGFGIYEDSDKASHYWENKDKIISSHGYKDERENIKIWHATGKLLIK